jgi:parallel beta-helix repeat protein
LFKKVVCIYAIVLILNGILIPFLKVQKVSGEWTGTVYIRADGSIDPPDAPVSTFDKVTYTLTGDIFSNANGIVVENSNIVIDGAGRTVAGNSTSDSKGIYLSKVSKVTIKNTCVRNFHNGIELTGSSHCVIVGNIITDNGAGVHIDDSVSIEIFNNTITNNSIGVIQWTLSDSIISGNTITNNMEDGVWLAGSSNSIISGNNIGNNHGGIIIGEAVSDKVYNPSYNIISGNTIINNYGVGIQLDRALYTSIIGNIFIKCGLVIWTPIKEMHNFVSNNTVNNKPLIYLEKVSSYEVENAGQVVLVNCDRILLKGLNLSDVDNAVQLHYTNNTIITGNIITRNNWPGITLYQSFNNVISENIITNNWAGIGIYESSSNSLYHNNFVNNTYQSRTFKSANVWDDGYPSGGNYWSDYTGVDLHSGQNQDLPGSDGIGDTPYVIDSNNVDHYPLMSPYAPSPQDTVPPTVRVLAPNGGESLTSGGTFRIRWEATDNVGVSYVHIWLFQDSRQIDVIASNYPNTGYYDWAVPDRVGSGYKVRIAAVDAAGNAGYDDSDSTFTITTAGFPYFEVEVSPASQTVNQGGTATYTVIVKSFNGFNRQISFTGYAQNGISLTFSPETVTPPANGVAQSQLTVATSSSLPVGKYGISIECKDVGGQVRWATIELNVVEVHRIASTILAANTLPFNRIFPINVRIKSLDSVALSLRVALEERTGFQAGVVYGDGDEIKDLTLSPGEEVELSFKAKVYGITRVEDVARFRFYAGGQLIEQKDQTLNLNPEFAEASTFTCPAAVKMGGSFTIGVPVFYSFAMDTVLTLTLTNEENGKNLVITDVLNGDGMKIYSFRVNSSFVNLNSEGVRSFKVTVETKYPEENYKTAYEKKFAFKVRVSNNVGTSSIIPDSGFIITLNYKGIQYFALYAYNATEAPPSQSEKIEDILRWAYSRQNWLIFEAVNGNFKPVMDDELYKTLAFASETAYLRATIWNENNLLSRSNWFKELSELAAQAESWNFIAKLAGKLAGIIGLKAANMWASSVPSGIEAGTKASDLAMTATRTVEILNEIKLYEDVLKAINKVGATEEALVWTSIFLLNGGSADLEDANKLLTTISLPAYPPFVINVNVNEALTFYRLIQSGETKGLSGMRFLSTHYAKDQIDVMGVKVNIGAFKNALIESLGVVGNAYEFHENLKNKFNIPEVFEFAQHLVTMWDEYEMRREICQSASLKFRDTYIKETSNGIDITLTEPETQHKLYLSVYDTEGRIIGFNRTSGTIESQIPNSYYIGLGNMIKVNIPLDVKIKRILIDAAKAELSTENYTLKVEVYKDGNLVGTTTASGQVNMNTQKEYSLQSAEDLKPILNEATQFTPLQYVAVAVAVGCIIAVIVLTLISKRKKHTSSQFKMECGGQTPP